MTKQWDKYREIIIAEYKDQNKPLHEVRRVMLQKYGFRASSRFDRWRIHKYSRRRRLSSMSLSRRESVSDGDHPCPRESPDMEESSSHVATPIVATPNELLTPGIGVAKAPVGFRRPLCLVKTDFAYTPVTPSPSPAIAHNPAFHLNHFGSGYVAFGSQNTGCYPSNSVSMYRQDLRDVMIVDPHASEPNRSNMSPMAGIPAGYGYSLGLIAAQD